MDLWIEDRNEFEDGVVLAAVLEHKTRTRLWFRVPGRCKDLLTGRGDPFLLGFLFHAMRFGGRLAIHGMVAPSLLRNLEEFQAAWTLWRPKAYRKIEFVADREEETPGAGTGASIMGFSGGVDSSFTAWRHRTGRAEHQQLDIRAGVMVHGFDIPLQDADAFAGASEKAGAMLRSLGMDLIPVATNFREMEDDWEDAFASALAATLSLFSGGFEKGVIASSYAYSYLVLPYGSNPMTDGLLSSSSFPIVHDGAGFPRLEKTRGVAQWPEALKYLRVCWQGAKKDRNCCRCQKCVSNILYFRIAGIDRMECFPDELSNEEIAHLPHTDESMVESTERLIRLAKQASIDSPWVGALQAALRRYQRRKWLKRIGFR